MHTQNSVFNESGQRDVVENLSAVAPHIHRAVLSETFVIEAIDLSDLSAFVVSADQSDAVWVPHFERQEKKESFD